MKEKINISLSDFQKEIEAKYRDSLNEIILLKIDDFTIQIAMIKLLYEFTGKKIGRKILQDICEYSDNNNLLIELTASSAFGVSEKSLHNFYVSFGFKKIKNKYERNPR